MPAPAADSAVSNPCRSLPPQCGPHPLPTFPWAQSDWWDATYRRQQSEPRPAKRNLLLEQQRERRPVFSNFSPVGSIKRLNKEYTKESLWNCVVVLGGKLPALVFLATENLSHSFPNLSHPYVSRQMPHRGRGQCDRQHQESEHSQPHPSARNPWPLRHLRMTKTAQPQQDGPYKPSCPEVI